MDWERYAFVTSSKARTRVVNCLGIKAKAPSDISKEIGLSLSETSRALKELSNKNIVTCVAPNLRKGRLYILTFNGKGILSKIIEDEKEDDNF